MTGIDSFIAVCLRAGGWIAFLGIGLLVGCARFHPEPISPGTTAAALEDRSLTNASLKTFLEQNLHHELAGWPAVVWDFDKLALVAFYYHPDLELARAEWSVAQAGIKTAGGRPNPTLSLVPGYNTTASSLSPWLPAVSFDVPIETAGKRKHRIAAATHTSDAARWNTATIAWQVRSRVRSSLVELSTARRREALLRTQVSFQEQTTRLIEQQVEQGELASPEATRSRIALQKLRLDLANAEGQRVAAQVRLAQALGVPSRVLDGVELSVRADEGVAAAEKLTAADVRRTALESRSDILSALAEYGATEAALQLEIAKQYPDVHISPGYQFDQGDNKWTLGITFDLPVLNQNQGPIAEAEARRRQAAARFDAVQAAVLGEIDRAVESFRIAQRSSVALGSLAESQARQRDAAEAQFRAGAIERVDWLGAQAEFLVSEQARLDAETALQQAVGALEDAVQRPISDEAAFPSSMQRAADQAKRK